MTQLTFNAETLPAAAMEMAGRLRSEFVIAVTGAVVARTPGTENANLATGDIEVAVDEVQLLNESAALPFGLADHDTSASDDIRLEYRYLDLRRPALQSALELRHRVCQSTRRYLDGESFVEIETPLLVRPTPEGARDYLVPSRVRPRHFYALPQSPQLYKQLLMVSGFDRYFQIAKCLRDEDLRADRQPEFSQIDLEMTFVDEEDVYALVEGLMARVIEDATGRTIRVPFPRLTFQEAMDRFGSDKPDTRFDLSMRDVSALFARSEFRAFRGALDAGGVVKVLVVPASMPLTRKAVDGLEETAKRYGAKGLARAKVGAQGLEGGIAKFVSDEEQRALRDACPCAEGDHLLFVADRWRTACTALGAVRLEVGRAHASPDPSVLEFLWVNDFYLFEEGDAPGKLAPAHHMFTMPRTEDLPLLDTEPLRVRAQLYDLVLNGNELGSGSIRVHRRDLQSKIFALTGMDEGEAERRFGFLLKAFDYGAPPHGGIALGLERIIMILTGRQSIRDTIAFPKTSSAASLVDGAPSSIPEEDLVELGIAFRPKTGDAPVEH